MLNPVRARMVAQARDWTWSSYRATVGLTHAPPYLTIDWLLSAFGADRKQARLRYERFVADGVDRPSPWQHLKYQIYLGSERFVESMQQQIRDEQPLTEIPAKQRRPPAQPLPYFAEHYPNKARAIAEAYRSGGYSMQQIADFFAVGRMTVSRAVKRHGSTTKS